MSNLPTDRWQKEAEKLMTSVLGKPYRQTVETIAAALATVFETGRQDAMKSEVAWEATTPYYKQFITQERYEGFKKHGYHRWYKPYRCSSCAPAGQGNNDDDAS